MMSVFLLMSIAVGVSGLFMFGESKEDEDETPESEESTLGDFHDEESSILNDQSFLNSIGIGAGSENFVTNQIGVEPTESIPSTVGNGNQDHPADVEDFGSEEQSSVSSEDLELVLKPAPEIGYDKWDMDQGFKDLDHLIASDAEDSNQVNINQAELKAKLIDTKDQIHTGDAVIFGSENCDELLGGPRGQTIYHNGSAFTALLSEPHASLIYSNYVDGAHDTIDGGGGDDTIFFGTGDLVSTGDGSDSLYAYLDIDMNSGRTEITDFDGYEDTLVIFVPNNIDYEGLEQDSDQEVGAMLTLKTSGGDFSLSFSNLIGSINVEVVHEQYDAEQHPLKFLADSTTMSHNIYIVVNSGYH